MICNDTYFSKGMLRVRKGRVRHIFRGKEGRFWPEKLAKWLGWHVYENRGKPKKQTKQKKTMSWNLAWIWLFFWFVCVFFGLFGFFVCVLIYVVIIFGFYLKQTVYKQTCVYKHVGLMSGWSERRGMINLRADADVSTSNMLLLPIKIATIESMIMSRFDALSRTPNIDFRGKKKW